MRRAGAGMLLAMLCAGAAADTIRADDARVLRMGRTAPGADGAIRFGYAGVTLRLAFEGTRLEMRAAGGKGNLLEVVVDGGRPVTLKPGTEPGRIELVKDAGPGRHTVELVHRTEGWLGTVSVQDFSSDGAFVAPPPLPARKLLVLGDSVTCGAAMERTAKDNADPYWWNARVSYGLLLARELDAQAQLVCHGGRGLVRSWNGRTDEANLPDFYRLAIDDDAHPLPWRQSGYTPDLVLVAIGTNDFTPGIPERAAYVAAYEAFVRTLLRDFPRARIALTEGAILNGEKKAALTAWLAETVERAGSERVRYLPSAWHPGDARDAHPTTAQHAEMARELAPPLRQWMGW